MQELNDVHSALNPTPVLGVVRPTDLASLRAVVIEAKRTGTQLSVGGGRHAMGGQQFARHQTHIDTTHLNHVLATDAQRGLLRIEAGAMWPDIISASHTMQAPSGGLWAIRQKQTGVDAVTLAGSIAANAHGRGLLMQPLVDDIEDITLVDAQGDVVQCSRRENAQLFAHVVGGYGLFGVVYAATLRLTPRQRVVRLVDVLDLSDAMNAVFRRVEQGCVYGDFQFVIDPADPSFLHRGVFACYRPVDEAPGAAAGVSPRAVSSTEPRESSAAPEGASADLSPDAWLQLLRLAHDDKAMAFKLYAQHYLGTHGNTYWADSMQLSTYLPNYADFLAKELPAANAAVKETLVIGEHYVPRDQIANFMARARDVLLMHGVEVIYGTIRSILRDTTTALPWAKDDYACVIFNLRTVHTPQGKQRTGDAFRGLMGAALDLGGSYFLTYHRHATKAQVLQAYPTMPAFLATKQLHDPGALFTSDWYVHHRDLLA